MGSKSLFAVVALALVSSAAFGQSPIMVKYCQDLTASYRKAVASGKTPGPGAGQAAANGPTNPDASVTILEAALKQFGVELPPK